MKRTKFYNNCYLVSVILCCVTRISQSAFLPSIQWTPQNPIIQNLNGNVRNVRSDDGLHIWCPKDYTQLVKTKGQIQPANLYFTLYKVESKQEYDDCDARKGKKLLTCDDPEKVGDVDYKLLLFQEKPIFDIFDPYKPGETYYFIGTSGGRHSALHNKFGGKCATDNLKFAIHVCGKNEKNCNIDVRNGGWSTWRKNPNTGMCERNCTSPEPQNGGDYCKGSRESHCSEVIIDETKIEEVEIIVSSTDGPTTTEDTGITSSGTESTAIPTIITTKKTSTLPVVDLIKTTAPPKERKTTLAEMASEQERGIDKEAREDKGDSVTLSMKEAVLTFIGLFIVGCMVGIVQVLVILHFRSKRMHTKQPEPASPVNV